VAVARIGALIRARPDYLVAFLLLILLTSTSNSYGWHRDELYFVVAGQHPDWGYPDQPLFTPLIVAGLNTLGGGSLIVVRLASGIAAAGTAIVTASIASALGGTARARLLAALSWAVGGVSLVSGHFVDTTTFDILATAAVCLCLIRAVTEESGRWVVAAGGLLGLGLLNKMIIGAVVGLIVAMLLILGPRSVLLTRAALLAVGLALLGAAPYLVWQSLHDWPQASIANSIAQADSEGGRVGVIPFQFLLISPFLAPLWIAGLVGILRSRSFRSFGVAYVGIIVLLIASGGKAYYAAGLLPVFVASGGVAVDRWMARGARAARLALFSGAALVGFAINAVLGLSILPIGKLTAVGAERINPDSGEQVGWDKFTTAVARGYTALPEKQRTSAVIFTQNYGEAGAIDKFGPALGLPTAFSGHNGFALWGPPRLTGPVELVGFSSQDPVLDDFTGCHVVTRFDNGYHLNNVEQGAVIRDCSGTTQPWSTIWTSLRHYD
jgi:4-amino-4-deoxy-L-arabinose transferase-like glycosyltransferase